MEKSISGDVTGIFKESYEEEFILNPNNNEFIPAFWKGRLMMYIVYANMARKISRDFGLFE